MGTRKGIVDEGGQVPLNLPSSSDPTVQLLPTVWKEGLSPLHLLAVSCQAGGDFSFNCSLFSTN